MEYANIKCLGKKTIENSSPIHQTHTSAMIKNINLKVDHHTGGPQTTPQRESVVKPGTLLLIILSLVCKCDIQKVYGNLSNPFVKMKVRQQKHPREADKFQKWYPMH